MKEKYIIVLYISACEALHKYIKIIIFIYIYCTNYRELEYAIHFK